MARSSVTYASSQPSTFARRFWARANEGAVASAAVFIVCFLSWSLGPPAFEAQGILGLPYAVKDRNIERMEPAAVANGVLIVTANDFAFGYPTFSDSVYGFVNPDGRKLRVRCRASSRERAVSQCRQVFAAVQRARPDITLSTNVTVAEARSPIHWPGVVIAFGIALLGGIAFMAYSALFRRVRRAAPHRPAARVEASAEVPDQPANTARVQRLSSDPAPVLIFDPKGAKVSVAPSRSGRPPREPYTAPPEPEPRRLPSQQALVVEVRSIPPEEDRPLRRFGAASSPGDSLPMPEIPEGPMVQALPVRGFTPHPRLVRSPSDERFVALCDRIAWNADDAPCILGVTSATDIGAKAPMVAARLGWFVARLGKVRVLLLEAEFEAPLLHTVVGIDAPPQGGFSQQLQARLGPARNEPWRVQRCAPMLDVLVESRFRTHRAPHVPQFEQAMEVFRMHYDVVIACMPPIDVLAGRASFRHLADQVVAVVERGGQVQSTRLAAAQAFGQERVLAVIEETEFGERTTFAPHDA